MRIAVQNPFRALGDQTRNHNGYNYELIKQFKPIIYLPDWQLKLNYNQGWRNFLRSCKNMVRGGFGLTRSRGFGQKLEDSWLNPDEFDFAFTIQELKRKADVLICFNGYPYKAENAPVKEFDGLKIYHAYEYVFRATESNQAFEDAGVDYLMGYTDHGKYCRFFQQFYPNYKERVIPVPFGWGKRFEAKTPFSERVPKVVALGAVNPVDDPTVKNSIELKDYIQFYEGTFWTHQWRRMIVEHEAELTSIVDSQLPHYPKTKDYSYDAVGLLNQYALFANDEGLMAFPPARTYEGTAAGAVMVSSDHPSYKDLGFQDGVNCIMHKKHDISDFREKVKHYLENPEQLSAIAQNSVEMVRSQYSHEQVARNLYKEIKKKWQQ
jgi:hypothetical protein